ncbi:DUF6686 family protein [Flammeovirgaceae bacterium SG7u.111]|nr:DUF6686 family protein [Flammeovirgaceae bacterium SG7u.132]WPO38568.1 DUF6686 family protein [Flammeovirgaceae bacterium SG7u.111]
MCSIEGNLILTETSKTCLSWCRSCNTFFLTYKNCCSLFVKNELWQFRDVLEELQEADYRFYLMGKWHTIVKNPQVRVGFCITPEDTVLLKKTIEESLTLYEAYQVLYNTTN